MTFEMQWDDAGRARAVQQGVDNFDNLQEAIETCPVNCIHRQVSGQHLKSHHGHYISTLKRWLIVAPAA